MRLITVTATYAPEPSGLQISIEDDGRGFDPAQPHASNRGVRNQQHRASRIGADLRITSGPAGTRVSVQWPVNPQASNEPASS